MFSRTCGRSQSSVNPSSVLLMQINSMGILVVQEHNDNTNIIGSLAGHNSSIVTANLLHIKRLKLPIVLFNSQVQGDTSVGEACEEIPCEATLTVAIIRVSNERHSNTIEAACQVEYHRRKNTYTGFPFSGKKGTLP